MNEYINTSPSNKNISQTLFKYPGGRLPTNSMENLNERKYIRFRLLIHQQTHTSLIEHAIKRLVKDHLG